MTTSLVIDNPQELEDFKSFCLYKQQFQNEGLVWKQVREYAVNMQFGSFTLTIKNGIPVRIDQPLKVLVLTNSGDKRINLTI